MQACSTTFKGKLMFAQVTNPPPELLQQFGALAVLTHSARGGLLVCLFALFRLQSQPYRFALLCSGMRAFPRRAWLFPVVLLVSLVSRYLVCPKAVVRACQPKALRL